MLQLLTDLNNGFYNKQKRHNNIRNGEINRFHTGNFHHSLAEPLVLPSFEIYKIS